MLTATRLAKITGYIFLIFMCLSHAVMAKNHANLIKTEQRMTDVTILIPSCDKYSELWDGFFHLLFQHWPSLNTYNSQIPIILVGNQKTFPNARVQTLLMPHEQSWSHNIQQALTQVKTPYVLILLEDYFITYFNEQKIFYLLNFMRVKPQIGYIQTSYPNKEHFTGPLHSAGLNLAYKKQFDIYRPSLQAALWRTDELRHLVRPGENAWEFEIEGNVRSQGSRLDYLFVEKDSPIMYMNVAHLGFLHAKNIAYFRQMGIPYTRGALLLDQEHSLHYWLKCHLRDQTYKKYIAPIYKFFS